MVVLLLLCYGFVFTIHVVRLFLTVPKVGMQFVIVVFHDHTHLLFVRTGKTGANSQRKTFYAKIMSMLRA